MTTRAISKSKRTLIHAMAMGVPMVAAIACGTGSPEATGTSDEALTGAATNKPMLTPVPDGTVTGTYPGEGVPAYQGGKILSGTVLIAPIFYGTAWQPNYQADVIAFLKGMSNTSYWQIIQGYTDSAGNHPGAVDVATPVNVTSYSLGRTLTSANIATIVQNDVTAGAWPTGAQYLYMVFTADDVTMVDPSWGNLCASYLGWHWLQTVSWTNLIPATISMQVPIAFIGSAQYCINHGTIGDPVPWAKSVNGTATDMGVTIAEDETAEAVTDPYPLPGQYGWSPEVGDICAWIPGPASTVSGTTSDLGAGEPYTPSQMGYAVNQGSRYVVQTLWDTNQNGCAYGPADLDGLTKAAACGAWKCGTASNGEGSSYDCGDCLTGQTCSTQHICTGKAITCHTPAQCCAQAGGDWEGHYCE
jgi:hypothetical protein